MTGGGDLDPHDPEYRPEYKPRRHGRRDSDIIKDAVLKYVLPGMATLIILLLGLIGIFLHDLKDDLRDASRRSLETAVQMQSVLEDIKDLKEAERRHQSFLSDGIPWRCPTRDELAPPDIAPTQDRFETSPSCLRL